MFNIYNMPDVSQMVIKKQLRSNFSLLYLIKSVDNVPEFIDILKMYSSKCTEVFYNKEIEKPTYDETNEIMSVIGSSTDFKMESIYAHIQALFNGLSMEDINLLTETIYTVFQECIANNVSVSKLKNGYIRTLVTLRNRLSNVVCNLNKDNKILYVGKPDKFDILTFTVLGLCGTDVVICDFDPGMTSECLCVNRFVLISGAVQNVDISFLKYANEGVKDIGYNAVLPNEWVNFRDYSELEDVLRLLNVQLDTRLEKNKWKVIHINVEGVSDKSTYDTLLETFLMNTKASGRPYVLFDNSVIRPTYDEIEEYKRLYKNNSVFDIVNDNKVLKNTGVCAQVSDCFEKVMNSHSYANDNIRETQNMTLIIWLIRYLKVFYSTNISKIPIVIYFGKMTEKENDLLDLLSCLPTDVIVFKPNYSTSSLPVDRDGYKVFRIGKSDASYSKYPENAGLMNASTVAYNAEKELDNVLFSDTSLFKIKQFTNSNAITLKTTYEEVSILWNEPAKFRPSFESVGNLVTVPTIFTKINGVNETYRDDIGKLIGQNVLFFKSFPIQLYEDMSYSEQEFRQFFKQLVFKNSIDFDKLRKSKYYNYGVFSEETQSVIFEKVQKLIDLDWCATPEKNLVYDILDTVFRMPHNIVQMIHNFDFTGDIPKVIIYNGGTKPCSLSDCILIMFLKLVGFDILVYAPTGYRVIEQYIGNKWFNEITIGLYDFNLEDITFNSFSSIQRNSNQNKKGFFKKLFG